LLANAASNAAAGGSNAEPPDELHGLGGANEAVHTGVLPLDRDRPVVADRVQPF
jgi:hypothetical protein